MEIVLCREEWAWYMYLSCTLGCDLDMTFPLWSTVAPIPVDKWLQILISFGRRCIFETHLRDSLQNSKHKWSQKTLAHLVLPQGCASIWQPSTWEYISWISFWPKHWVSFVSVTRLLSAYSVCHKHDILQHLQGIQREYLSHRTSA